MYRSIHIFKASLSLMLLTFAVSSLQAQPATQPAQHPGVSTTMPQDQYWFGVSVDNIPPVFGRLLQLPPGQGLLVVRVIPESPAGRAGIQPGDLLIKLGDKPLTSPMQLIYEAQTPKHTAQVELIREGKGLCIDMRAEPRPRDMRPIVGFAGPNAPIVQVGPGVVVDLEQADKAPALQSVRTLTRDGQRVLITQEIDAQGHVHRRITVGLHTYEIDPGKLDELPPEVRELARRLVETPQERMRRELAALKQAVKELESRVDAEAARNPATAPANHDQ